MVSTEVSRSRVGSDWRRRVVVYSLLLVTIVFCCAVGYGLSMIEASVWTVLLFSFVLIAAIQISFLAGMLLIGRY
jgi:hypothetical protein